MDKIKWCMKQNKGINLIQPLEHMGDDYMQRAENDLLSMIDTEGSWKVIMAYYACYNMLYSLLIKTGIKSEIHDCSIELMKLYGFEEKDIQFMKKLKEDRIQNQYYIKNLKLEDENKIKNFLLILKKTILDLNQQKIEEIREEIIKRKL